MTRKSCSKLSLPATTAKTMPPMVLLTFASAMYTENWVAATAVQHRFMNKAMIAMKMSWPAT